MDIRDLTLVRGGLPRRARELAVVWAAQHREELLAACSRRSTNWRRCFRIRSSSANSLPVIFLLLFVGVLAFAIIR